MEPRHEGVRLRFLSERSLTPERREILASAAEATFLPMEAIGEQGSLDTETVRPVEDVKSGYTMFFDGDVVIAKITPCFENGKGALIRGMAGGLGFGTTELHVVAPKPDLDARYLYYLTASSHFRYAGEAQMTGAAGQKRVPTDFVLDYRVPVLDQTKQRAIADFLDAETTRIDSLISAKENLLAILTEKRSALVTHAVTRGLDTSVPMRDSGVPWLGEIPAHWEVTRVGLLASVQNGSTPSRNRPEYWDPDGIPWVSSGQVNDYDVTQAEEYISAEGMRASNLRIVPAGSVLVGMIGQGRTRGMSARLLIDACINQNVAAVAPRDSRISGDFLHLVFEHAYDPLRNYGRGGNQAALNCEIIGEFQVPLPPRTEQDEIVDSVRSGKKRLEALESAVAASLPFIRERREAVIAAAVTGQLCWEDGP